ncbi:hypothetical protein ACFXP3_02770 [Streptomyces sp. NPDC059096]|uniref:hypothetical protein n=1 Tax=Streptomyces sp. NPDC059096 TaxID=3346727 RepID=UPI003673A250
MTLITAVLCTALATTACTGDNGNGVPVTGTTTTRATAAPTPPPALTRSQARDAITNYSKINNVARASHDRALLDTVEGGPRYAMSLADLKQDQALPKGREPYRPWAYNLAATDLYIPRLGPGEQRWFAAVTRAGSKKQYARVLILAEEARSKGWEMVATIDLDDPQDLPEIVLDEDGYATAVDAASKTLATPVGVLRSAVVDNFVTGGQSTGRKLLAATAPARRQIKVHDETSRKFGPKGTSRFATTPTEFTDAYALKTTSGAFVVFSHTHTQHDAATAPGLQIVPEKEDRAWLGTRPSPVFVYRFTCSDAAAVPDAPGRSRLLGYGCRRTDAQAPAPSISL